MAELMVETSTGKIRGAKDSTGIHSFKGIPYGASTGGFREQLERALRMQ